MEQVEAILGQSRALSLVTIEINGILKNKFMKTQKGKGKRGGKPNGGQGGGGTGGAVNLNVLIGKGCGK